MFDKNGFYFTKEVGFDTFDVDVGASRTLKLQNNEYVAFHKRRFVKKNTNQLQKGIALVCERNNINFQFDKEFFVYGLTYYQRNLKEAFIKGGDLEELETYEDLFKKFDLELKLRKYLEIRGNYKSIEEIKILTKGADLNQAISFLLALGIVYGDWNITEDDFLSNIVIKFPFDSSLVEFQEIIFDIEEILLQNKIYNKLTLNKKQEFIWNIYDADLLKVIGESTVLPEFQDFYGLEEKIGILYDNKFKNLQEQLNIDLRIKLDSFKLVELVGVSKSF